MLEWFCNRCLWHKVLVWKLSLSRQAFKFCSCRRMLLFWKKKSINLGHSWQQTVTTTLAVNTSCTVSPAVTPFVETSSRLFHAYNRVQCRIGNRQQRTRDQRRAKNPLLVYILLHSFLSLVALSPCGRWGGQQPCGKVIRHSDVRYKSISFSAAAWILINKKDFWAV